MDLTKEELDALIYVAIDALQNQCEANADTVNTYDRPGESLDDLPDVQDENGSYLFFVVLAHRLKSALTKLRPDYEPPQRNYDKTVN